ncbi:hypothetical protein GCM10022600_15130 [Qipengyuania pelagi]|uniref:Uncharacterized protein n=1 Tax=Qipengyuania pelagi TaxID=994320 RepID=A0A844Y9H0_9SPHN|nr:hypothetical protein [Qipengyuania pelagi]MXO53632.1 hypothetical protein [Qipengyuania pelagi]
MTTERTSDPLALDVLAPDALAADYLDGKADRIEAMVAPDRVQPHSRKLPNEAELSEAKFAARQLRVAADEIRGGFHLPVDTGGTQDGASA